MRGEHSEGVDSKGSVLTLRGCVAPMQRIEAQSGRDTVVVTVALVVQRARQILFGSSHLCPMFAYFGDNMLL